MSKEKREKKAEIINQLEELFSRCAVGIFTDYRGLTTPEITALRRSLQASSSEYKVVKNTLAGFAAERAGKDILLASFEGPIAIAFGYDDITAPAKALASFIRDSKLSLNIKGGFLGNRLLTAEEVTTLAALPSREVLLARVLGQMKSPISILVNCFTSPIRGIIGVLQARIRQLEGG